MVAHTWQLAIGTALKRFLCQAAQGMISKKADLVVTSAQVEAAHMEGSLMGKELRWSSGCGHSALTDSVASTKICMATADSWHYGTCAISNHEMSQARTMAEFFSHPAWPLVDGALLVSKRRSLAPDDLLTFGRM